jgi:hypothetical protein
VGTLSALLSFTATLRKTANAWNNLFYFLIPAIFPHSLHMAILSFSYLFRRLTNLKIIVLSTEHAVSILEIEMTLWKPPAKAGCTNMEERWLTLYLCIWISGGYNKWMKKKDQRWCWFNSHHVPVLLTACLNPGIQYENFGATYTINAGVELQYR